MLRLLNPNMCVLAVFFIIITFGLVATQVNLTLRYSGGKVTASLHSFVTFNWIVTGEVRTIEFGTKDKDSNSIGVKLLTLGENGQTHLNVSLYNGRVYGSWNPKSSGQVSVNVTDIKEVDNRFFVCIFIPTNLLASPVTDTVQLVVEGLPEVTIIPTSLSLGIGMHATFACNASGFPVPNIKWKLRSGSSEIEIENDRVKYHINFGSGSAELVIKNVTVTDNGYYICEASNFRSVRARAFLGVISLYLDEDICPKRIEATIGESRTICCPVKGYPTPDIFWQVPNGTFRYSFDITLPVALETDNDFGGYRCRAIGLEEKVEYIVTVHKIEPTTITHNGTIVLKPGDMFSWEIVPGAVGYLLRINETYFTKATFFLFTGDVLSAEIPYSSLDFRSKYAYEINAKVTVTIEVVPIGVSGRQNDYTVEIYASATTSAVSLMTLVLSFVFYNLP